MKGGEEKGEGGEKEKGKIRKEGLREKAQWKRSVQCGQCTVWWQEGWEEKVERQRAWGPSSPGFGE